LIEVSEMQEIGGTNDWTDELKTFPAKQRRCQRDVLWRTVPQPGTGDRKARSPMVERQVRVTW